MLIGGEGEDGLGGGGGFREGKEACGGYTASPLAATPCSGLAVSVQSYPIIIGAGGAAGAASRGSEPSGNLVFDRVLTLSDEGGSGGTVGTPYIKGASVAAEIVAETKGKKLVSVMYKRRKGMRRKIGHRQQYLTVRIGDITAG